MAGNTLRTVDIYESTNDLQLLSQYGFNFNIAKSVMDSTGNLSFNTIWKSASLAPRMSISWNVQYALNWTDVIPLSGTTVTMGGIWQDCNPGETYNIDQFGLFHPSQSSGQPNFLNIGGNKRASIAGNGIHIVIGIKEASGYSAIWVDTVPLAIDMTSWYQPKESVMWWYDRTSRSSVMFGGTATNSQGYDMSTPRLSDNKYYVSSTYIYSGSVGKWNTSSNDAPSYASMMMDAFNADASLDAKPGIGGLSDLIGMSNLNGMSDSDLGLLFLKLLRQVENSGNGKPLLTGPGSLMFIAKVNWPATVLATAVITGSVLIANKLASEKYMVQKTVKDNDHQYTFYFGPSTSGNQLDSFASGDPLSQATQAWQQAIAADSKDQAMGGAVTLA